VAEARPDMMVSMTEGDHGQLSNQHRGGQMDDATKILQRAAHRSSG
jgi:hypothetical protein